MYRLQAKVAKCFLALAIVATGAELGTMDAASSLAIHRPNPNTRADAQLWKSAFLTLRANATLVPSRNGQPHDVPLYRNFGKDCRSAVRGTTVRGAPQRARLQLRLLWKIADFGVFHQTCGFCDPFPS